jgi:GNAT superfamily N-acetyltransferase
VEQTFGPWQDEEQRARFFGSTDPATHQVIELGGEAIGCLDVRWLPDQVKLNRIFLLPAHQSRGIGAQLVGEILSRARSAGLPVRLRVFRVNHAARRFYERLGFVATGETDTHTLMEHNA